MKLTKLATGLLLATSLLSACSENNNQKNTAPTLLAEAKSRLDIYKPVTLTADLSHLSANQKKMIVLLIEASDIIDELFWQQAFGEDKETFLASIEDEKVREFARINYGPWDRLDGDKPFLTGVEEKAPGAEFYPSDLTKEEFEQADFTDKDGQYSVVQRNSDGQLTSVAYSELYSDSINRIAAILEEASSFADDKEFANYLNLRATAIRHDDFQASDFAWMDMKNNPIDVVIGPIETYEDQLYGYRTAFESYVLIKDLAWSKML